MPNPVGRPPKRLNKKQKQRLVDLYSSSLPKKEVQEILAKEFNCSIRQIRRFARDFGLNVMHKNIVEDKIMVYDIETSRIESKVWQTGKQYINYKQLRGETTIVSISWKWIGEDKVHHLTWDKNHCDEEMVTKFVKEYNR